MKNYQYYFFDMDGTLVDSEPLKGQALALACKDFGASVDFNVYRQVMGQDWKTVTHHFFSVGNISPSLETFNIEFRRHYEALLTKELTLITGVEQYLQVLKQQGKTLAVVSSAATWMVEHILDALKLNHVFDLIITQEDVIKHKPDPQAYLLALKRLNASAHDCVIFEDSNAGVTAGSLCGCDVIAVNHSFNGNNDLSAAMTSIQNYESLINE